MKTTTIISRKNSKFILILMIMTLISSNAFTQLAFLYQTLKISDSDLFITGKSDIKSTFPDTYELIIAEETDIEEWMKKPDEWAESSRSFIEMLPSAFIEEELEIENWMKVPAWNDVVDDELEIEYWMVSPKEWNIKN